MTARCCCCCRVNRLWEAARAANSIPSPSPLSFSQHSQNYSPFLNRSFGFGVVNMSGTRGSTNQQGKRKPVAAPPVWRPVSTQPERYGRADASKEKHVSSSSRGTGGGAAEETSGASGEKHSVSIEVDAALIHLIQRKGGATQQQIERETGVEIKFSSSKNDGQIVVEGISSECVTEASKRIAGVLEEIVKSPSLDYSHFISLPLAIHPELVEKLENFQNSILGCSTSSHDGNLDSDSSGSKLPSSSVLSELGIDRSIFIKPRTFHLTVLMLKLWNKDRVAAATEVLQKVSSKVNAALDNRPVFISLKGLLHATLMNARHRKRNKWTRKVDDFDARGIFLRYGSEDWGNYLIKEAHLSKRFMFEESGYYHCCASIPFPESMQVE